MGILRTDRVSGLGGANAITGSCFFDTKNYLKGESHGDFSLDGDFTIEWWTHREKGVTDSDWFTIGDAKLDTGLEVYIGSSGSALNVYSNNGTILAANSGSPSQEKWHHMALVRSSGTIKIYVDGTADSTTVSNSSIFNGFLHLGGEFYNGSLTVRSKMHMSNFRIVRKTALYTSNFTPPDRRLEVIPETAILCCQSSSDVTEEATGKKIYAERADNAGSSSNVQASRFTPNSPVGFSTTSDVGSQYGATFDGFGNFATSTYMVPPAGNTRERNRGRAIFAGGVRSPYKFIQVVDISSGGIAQDFGDTTTAAPNSGSASSSTRMLVTSGGTPAPINTIEFITIANIANSTDFGDLTEPRRRTQSLSNSTRAVHVGGTSASPASLYRNEIDFNTIATAGNAADFGDTLAAHVATGGSVASSTRGVYSVGYLSGSYVNNIEFITIATTGNGQDFGDLVGGGRVTLTNTAMSPTRGILAGGFNNTPSPSTRYNRIDFLTIATTGNTQDFGDLSVVNSGASGSSSNTRGIIFIGNDGSSPTGNNTIDFITIASAGNASDFGDSTGPTNAQGNAGAVTNTIKAVFAGGYGNDGSSTIVNTMDQVTIATTGNAVDFGDISEGTGGGANKAGCSDSHGGLTE